MGVATFSYPDSLIGALRDDGVPPFGDSGEFDSFTDVMAHARKLADKENMPIQYNWYGNKGTEYPEALRKRGY